MPILEAITLIIFELVLLILFGVFGRYGEYIHSGLTSYPMFQDVHTMIFVGFGFLMTFLKRYGFSAVGFNLLLASLCVQWAIICDGFLNLNDNHFIEVSIHTLYKADIATASVLISMGAVLGRASYMQLMIMGIIEIAVYTGNSYLGSDILKVTDAGGSIFVHTFGAYFGMAVSFVIDWKKPIDENPFEGSSYISDLFAMIGTIFLWIFWPSFNAIEVVGDDQMRAVINTYLSLAACTVVTFALSIIFSENHKFSMVHVQNSTLAGGVAVGTAANLMLQPYGAVTIGILAAFISVIGYQIITPCLKNKLRIRDTCGVHNLHGMPGVLGGFAGAVMAAIATENIYQKSLYAIFPARADPQMTPTPEFNFLGPGDGRDQAEQAGYQALAVVVTVAIAIVGGLLTGLLLRIPALNEVEPKKYYHDMVSWGAEGPEENFFDNPGFSA